MTTSSPVFDPRRKPLPTAIDWSSVLRLTIPAVPVAQPRQRHAVRRFGSRVVATNYTPTSDPVNAYKATLRAVVGNEWRRPPLACVLRVEVVFVFDRPQTLLKPKSHQGRILCDNPKDADNLQKSTFDALNKLLWIDDRQIVSVVAEKHYRSLEEAAHVELIVLVPASLL